MLDFWDLGGQFNYRAIDDLFLNEAHIFLFVFDITRPETLEKMSYWIEMARKRPSFDPNRTILIANKLDVGGNSVIQDNVDRLIKRYNIKEYFTVSAKERTNTQDLFRSILKPDSKATRPSRTRCGIQADS